MHTCDRFRCILFEHRRESVDVICVGVEYGILGLLLVAALWLDISKYMMFYLYLKEMIMKFVLLLLTLLKQRRGDHSETLLLFCMLLLLLKETPLHYGCGLQGTPHKTTT